MDYKRLFFIKLSPHPLSYSLSFFHWYLLLPVACQVVNVWFISVPSMRVYYYFRDASSKISNSGSLTKAQYELELEKLFSAMTPLDASNVEDCLLGKGLGFYVPETSGWVIMGSSGWWISPSAL